MQEYKQYEEEEQRMKDVEDISILYGTTRYPDPPPDYPTPIEKVKIKPYSKLNSGFMETPQFWMDLVLIG